MASAYRWGLSVGACAAVLVAASAGSSRADTLVDAIALAYQTNPTLQGQRAQLRFTDETYVQARAGYRPTASATASGTWQWTKVGTPACTILGCPPASTNINSLGTNVSLTQPLYTGGRATARVRGAEADVLAGRENLRLIEGQVMLNVIQVYVDVRRDEQSLAIRKDNTAVLQRQVDETRARFDVGEVTRTDVAQSEAQLAAAQSQLSQAQAQLAISRAAYASVVGQSPAQLEPEPAFKVFPETVDQAFDTTLQNNPSIRKADYTEQSADAQLAEAKAGRMPNIALQGQFGYSQPFSPWDTSMYQRNFTAGVSVSQPLFSGGVISSQIRQSIEQENFARIQLDQARRSADQSVSQTWNQLLAARAGIAADEEQVRAARVAFEGTRAEQQVGLRTTLEVLNAQQVLEEAELSLVNARHDEYVAAAGVLNVMGLLEARDIAPEVVLESGGHSFEQLKHTFGYIGPVEEGVSVLDSIGAKGVVRAPPQVDAPITTGKSDARPAQAPGG